MQNSFKMADTDDFVRGETLDLIMQILDDDVLDEAFQEEIDTAAAEVSLVEEITCFSSF